jgi:glycine hydroxymethyltransferase
MRDIIFNNLTKEKYRKIRSIELIAYENFVSNNVLKAILSNNTSTNNVEQYTIDRAKLLFKGTYANVLPNSQANEAVCMACLNPGDTILGFNLYHGFSLYKCIYYGLENDIIDYNKVLFLAKKEKPKLIICGAYFRDIDYKKFREVADQVEAILLADISHTAGFIAKGFFNDPLLYCHVITTTTHNILRGPIGCVIIMREDFDNPKFIKKNGCIQPISQLIDISVRKVCPCPLQQIISSKGIAFSEALNNTYTSYLQQVLRNTKKLVELFKKKGYILIDNGNYNHTLYIDLSNKSITSKEAQIILDKVDITCNKNIYNYNQYKTEVIRLGTAAITTRGLKENEMSLIADLIDEAILYRNNIRRLKLIKQKVNKIMNEYPIFYTE